MADVLIAMGLMAALLAVLHLADTVAAPRISESAARGVRWIVLLVGVVVLTRVADEPGWALVVLAVWSGWMTYRGRRAVSAPADDVIT